MIAVDTNLLVYAHREDSPWHDAASARITRLAEDRAPWAIPWPCLHEFLAIVTHPRIYALPTPLAAAGTRHADVMALRRSEEIHQLPADSCNIHWASCTSLNPT